MPNPGGVEIRTPVNPVGVLKACVHHHIREHELVSQNVTPTTRGTVHDLNLSSLPFPLRYIPTSPAQNFVIVAGGGINNDSIEKQIDAGGAGIIAAANEEVYAVSINGEWRRSQSSDGSISTIIAVDQAVTQIAANRILIGQCSLGRS